MPFPRFPIALFSATILLIAGCSTSGDESREGTLVLRSSTTGQFPDLDVDGYQVTGLPGGPVALGVNDTAITRLPPARYTLTITGLADNCISAPTQIVLTLKNEERETAIWDVTCGVLPGQAQVVFDPGGSTGAGNVMFAVDGQAPLGIIPGETLDLGDLSPGAHQLTVATTTPNCRVTNGASQPFTVVRSQLTMVTLAGYCSPGIIAFDENVTVGNMNSWSIYRMNADSSGIQALAGPGVSGGTYPALSPDGTQIVYATSYDSLMVMGSDGSNPHRIAQIGNVKSPVWSPAGNQIALSASLGIPYEVYVVDTTGANLLNITNDPSDDDDPSWSSDGNRIAFASVRSGSPQIYSTAPNGTGLDTLSTGGGYHPAWSPDQSQIAFAWNSQAWIMNQDGTNRHALPGIYGGSLSEIAWSPDGRFLAFYVNGFVYAPVDGSSATIILRAGNSPSSNRVSWSP